jgi:hypothetical protein
LPDGLVQDAVDSDRLHGPLGPKNRTAGRGFLRRTVSIDLALEDTSWDPDEKREEDEKPMRTEWTGGFLFHGLEFLPRLGLTWTLRGTVRWLV